MTRPPRITVFGTGRAVVDARHALDAAAWQACGWDYRAPGRPGTARTVAASDGPGARDFGTAASDGPGARGFGTAASGTRDAGGNGMTGTEDAERARVEVACLAAAS
jgi:hypothetical protein